MTISDAQRLERAEQFLWISARVLERVRFEQQFRAGPREPVLSALAAYQNRDGGFGQALEPDFRGPVSQPLAGLSALAVYDELSAFETCGLTRVAFEDFSDQHESPAVRRFRALYRGPTNSG